MASSGRLPKADAVQLLLKTHRLTIVILAPKVSTLGDLKTNAFSALQQFAEEEYINGVPKVSSVDDFEINRYSGQMEQYILLETSGAASETTVDNAGLKGWEKLFLQFRDASGQLMDIVSEAPPLTVEENEDEEM